MNQEIRLVQDPYRQKREETRAVETRLLDSRRRYRGRLDCGELSSDQGEVSRKLSFLSLEIEQLNRKSRRQQPNCQAEMAVQELKQGRP